MKKLGALFALVFIFSVSLIALESEPSETVGYVRYDCPTTDSSTNLSLVALPTITDITNVSDLADIIGVADQISIWDHDAQDWRTSIFFFGNWTNDSLLYANDIILVSVTDSTSFYCAGSLPSPAQYDLATTPDDTNLNVLMIPLNRSDVADVSDLATEIGVADQISNWDTDSQDWITSIFFFGNWTNDLPLDIAHPLMVSVTSDITWPTRSRNVNEFSTSDVESSTINK